MYLIYSCLCVIIDIYKFINNDETILCKSFMLHVHLIIKGTKFKLQNIKRLRIYFFFTRGLDKLHKKAATTRIGFAIGFKLMD